MYPRVSCFARCTALCACSVLSMFAVPASAQTYPAKAVRVKEDVAKWGKVVRTAGIKAQ